MASILRVLASSLLLSSSLSAYPAPQQTKAQPRMQGIFEGSDDIGHAQIGSTLYNPAKASYEIRGGGNDVWGTADDFRFTWTRLSGDGSLAADLHVDAPVTYRLSKGMLMFRQSLDPGSPYADIAIHADGHITLQYRLTQGGETKDVTLPEHNVRHLRIVRHGDVFTVYAQSGNSATSGNSTRTAAPSISIPMHDPVYVGLGVCSHNTDDLQTVTFSKVKVEGATH